MHVNDKEYIWAQKYRPNALADIILPAKIKQQFAGYVSDNQIPNLILTSPSPGTGKTTVALALCNELGIEPLLLNGNLDNTIDIIRERVVQYVSTVSMFDSNIKVVVYDEAERLSASCQEALKGLIELYSSNARFILTANNVQRILEPIRSRCEQVDFAWSEDDQKLVAAHAFKRITQVLDNESVGYDSKVLASYVKKKLPDIRGILTGLQAYAKKNSNQIDVGLLGQTIDSDYLVDALKTKTFKKVLEWTAENADRLNDDFYINIYNDLNDKLEGKSKAELILILGDAQRYHNTVPDRFIHFSSMLVQVMMNCQFKD